MWCYKHRNKLLIDGECLGVTVYTLVNVSYTLCIINKPEYTRMNCFR